MLLLASMDVNSLILDVWVCLEMGCPWCACRLLGTAEGLDKLIAALDKRGAREGNLYNSLLRDREALTQAMPASAMQ